MCRVPADEGAAVTEAVGDQSARDPVLFGNDFVVEVGADAENRAQAGIAVDRIKIVLVGAEIVVDEPCRTAVDRVHVAAAPA